MKKFLIFILAVMMVLLAVGCASPEQPAMESDEAENINEPERDITIDFDAYSLAGGLLRVTEKDFFDESKLVEAEYDAVGILGAVGESIGDALVDCGYTELTPVLEGDTFEGWMECAYDEEIGNYVISPETLYTTEELLALTVERDVMYVAKWQSIPAEEYFVVEAWDDSATGGGFAFTANGGYITCIEADETEYESPVYTYWLDEGQCLFDIMGKDYATLTAIRKDGAEFTGWTLYQADDMFWSDEFVEEDEMLCLMFNEADEWGGKYILLRNAVVLNENASMEELSSIICDDKNCLAVANWS